LQRLEVLAASTESDLEAAFATMVQHRLSALVVEPDPFFISQREQLVELAAHHTIPTIYPSRVFAEVGGLMSYGSSVLDLTKQGGIYVGKILRGAKPADLPIQQSTKVELVINLKTSKARSTEMNGREVPKGDLPMLPQKPVPEPAWPRSTNPATIGPRSVSGVVVAAISRSSCSLQRRAAPAGWWNRPPTL